ncbi:MAG: tetratricopeptide repeat protein [Alcanivoracaceae bacterium]|nr:tetratricopeptide repeat protein [Alcanivoracaceae bacterium]
MIKVYQSNWFLFVTLVSVLFALTKNSKTAAAEINVEKPLGFSVTKGAAADYIEDLACKQCHASHWDSYQHVGMSKSFVSPKAQNLIENFEAPAYYHKPSQRYYQIKRHDGGLMFKRYQLDADKQQINVYEKKIDWILGSGHKTRSYLYQTEVGEIFQLPLGWYSETQQWLMAPGYEGSFHPGVQRIVRRECMFCHNAFPDVAKGSDRHWQPHIFPKKLPEGTGCQRCHGPGAAHVRTVLKGGSLEQIRSAITNPAKLSPAKRDSVCFQCHLLPAVAVIGMRRFDRGDFSFRPGELASDYLLHVDVDDPELPKSERFEINHHAYRLRQSQCFIKSANKLTCISCHNPHKKVAKVNRVEHYAAVCLSCHKKQHKAIVDGSTDKTDCISCHMPQRRTQDVVHVVMTDHKIQRNIAGHEQRLAARKQKRPIIKGIEFLMPQYSPTGLAGEIYKTIILLRTVNTPAVIEHLEKLLIHSKAKNTLAYLDLANGQIILKRYAAAQKSLNIVKQSHPENIKVLQLQGILYLTQNRLKESKSVFLKVLAINHNLVDVHFNLGKVYIKLHKTDQAIKSMSNAVSIRPNMKVAWLYLAGLSVNDQRMDEAVAYYKKVLAIDPSFSLAYVRLAEVLLVQNNVAEAKRYLRHGIKVAKDNTSIILALDVL